MSVPVEYTTAKERLTNFRDSILAELVGGRVKAGLDASHAGMQKYSSVIQSMSVAPYLFGEVQRKAVALKLKGLDLGAGKIKQVRGDYALAEVDYPLQPPYNIPVRKLPQVDVFRFTPVTDLELLESTDTANLKTFFLIQAPHNTFEDEPSAENATYEYYEFFPQVRYRVEYNIIGQATPFANYKKIKGDAILFCRRLYKKGTTSQFTYEIVVIVNLTFYSDTELISGEPFATFVKPQQSNAPQVPYSFAGNRIPPSKWGLWAIFGKVYGYSFGGFDRIADGYQAVSEEETWRNKFNLEVSVNDEKMGTTNPTPATYKCTAYQIFYVMAVAKSGYVFDHWERDGININGHVGWGDYIVKDYKLKAVFRQV